MTSKTHQRVVAGLLVLCSIRSAHAQTVVPRSTEPSRSVTLSLIEYNRLTDLATRTPVPPPIAPVAAVLSNAELRVRIDGSTAHGSFRLAGQVLRPGVNRITLLTDATVLEANAEGRPLPMIVEGRSHQALLPGPGPFTANLEWGSALTLKPGRASFTLPVPPAGAVHAVLDVPGEQADVRLSAGTITQRSTLNGRTIVEATLDPASPTEVSWSMRDSAAIAAARDTRTVADVLTLVTLGDSDTRMVALVDLTVVQGEPRTAEMRLPSGYQLTGITGSSLESSEPADGKVVLTLADPAARRHQFLVTLERTHHDGSFGLETGLVAITGVQRERGEVAIEGIGTLDLATTERGGVHRIDVRELNPVLQSLARAPLLSAFRYQRAAAAEPELALSVTRFPDSGVLAAAVDHAVATTLITAEGRALTEVQLVVKNHAQPFLKVSLPEGATIVSVEVAGELAKPVVGTDGTRVPLLRPGFRPSGQYQVSFVYLHAGTPFGRKGDLAMTLPQMDIPVGVVEWEVFAPENYSLRYVDGNAVTQQTLERAFMDRRKERRGFVANVPRPLLSEVGNGNGIVISLAPSDGPGQMRGVARDMSGAVLPGVRIEIVAGSSRFAANTAADGSFRIVGVPQGIATIAATLPGFQTASASLVVGNVGHKVDILMRVGALEETISVSGNSPRIDRSARTEAEQKAPPSQNVINLQRRVAGVLPVRVDVPRAGTSYRFSRPLVVDDETRVSFHYRRK
jgi:hypothetical protein